MSLVSDQYLTAVHQIQCADRLPQKGVAIFFANTIVQALLQVARIRTRKSSLCAEKAAWHEVTRYKMAMATVDRTVHTQSMSKTMSICNGENNTCTRIVCSVWLR